MNLGKENEKVEFKKSTSELNAGLESISSMLNKWNEGTLYFGVKNNGDVIGQVIGDSTLRTISQSIANNIYPRITPVIEEKLIDSDKNIGYIKVSFKGKKTPYSASGKYFIRSADEDRLVHGEELRDLFNGDPNYDSITEIASRRQDLSFEILKNLYISKGYNINQTKFEHNLGFLTENGKYNLLAYLLADENDVSIKVAIFDGTSKADPLIEKTEYGDKCLILAMEQARNYVLSLNTTKVDLSTRPRKELKLFDEASFSEAWLNACLHTRWDMLNPPAIYIFKDRLEIISTGGLPRNLSKEDFFDGVSRPINKKLQKIFGQLDYVEQTGHGVPTIVKNYGKNVFDFMDHYLNVTIPFNYKRDTLLNMNKNETHIDYDKLSSSDRIVNYLNNISGDTIKSISKNVNLSESHTKRLLQELSRQNIVEHVGSNKTGYWKIKDKNGSD